MSPVLGFAWADRSSTLFGSGICAFSFSRFCIFWLLLIFVDVLHDEGNPAIRRVLRIVRFAKHLISETSDLGDLVWRTPFCCINRRAALARSTESSQFP